MSESGEVLKQALQTARGEADILDALARRVKFVDGGEGEPEIPTVEALAAYLPMAPETAQKEAGEFLEQLPWPRMILDGILVNNHDLKRARWRAQAPLAPATVQSILAPRRPARNRRQVLAAEAVFGWHPSDDARFEDWDYGSDPETEDKLTSLDGEDLDTAEVSADLNVEEVHELWRDADPQPRHPLAPLVRAWWKRPQHIEADTHPDAILPAGTLQHAPSSATYRSLEVGGDRTHEPEQFELAYPGEPGKVAPETVQLDLLPAEHADVPVTPLLLADAAGFSELQQGRGARLDKRIFLYALAAMPMSARVPGGSYMWEPTLEQIRDLLWPKSPRTGKSSWKPSKHDRALNQALDAVNLAKVKLPNRDLWLPVRTWRQPDPRNLDSRALIEIALPPGGAIGGPKLDRAGWIADGTHSDPAFDLRLSLAWLWDSVKASNGGHRVYATRPRVKRTPDGVILDRNDRPVIRRNGRPVKNWSDRRACPIYTPEGRPEIERHPEADRVPVLDGEARRRLAYGLRVQADRGNRYKERKNADTLLERLDAARVIVIERGATDPQTGRQGWRILEAWRGPGA